MFTQVTYRQLERASRLHEGQPLSIAVLGTAATQRIAAALTGALNLRGFDTSCYDAGYNQVDAQILDPTSELYAAAPDHILLFFCIEKLLEDFRTEPLSARTAFADKTAQKIQTHLHLIRNHLNCTVFLCDFPTVNDGVFGDYAYSQPASFPYQVRRLNFLLSEMAAADKALRIVPLSEILAQEGAAARDERLYHAARMAFTDSATALLAQRIANEIAILRGSLRKAVILDLDNTLWGGVIADDGLEGIALGELSDGRAFTALQSWLLELRRRGIILAVCSKNDDANARLPFEKHPDMVLRMEDISVFTANWNDKASNIAAIQQTLNIGFDAMVFLDDNPFEREQVKAVHPTVTVPDLPEDPAERLSYLLSLNLFGTSSYSEEDGQRTAQYIAEAARVEASKTFTDYNAYLESLDMQAECMPFTPYWYERIAELSQRSNQFNLRTLRMTAADVERYVQDENYITRAFTLSDKFGNHGLISVVLLKRQDDGWFIENWFMSCRVLKRGMEQFIINHISDCVNGPLTAEYIPTKKNALVAELYPTLGFEEISRADGAVQYRLPMPYTPIPTLIHVKEPQ